MPTRGDIVNDRYRLDEPVAQGGMGGVWRATDTVLGRAVAVKMLRTDARGDPAFAARFRDEARGLAALHHPGVVDVYDYDPGADDDAAYLVTAFVEGEPLTRRIATAGRLGTAETVSVVAQTARALDAVHNAGVIHHDVTPGNLIVQPDGSVILIDFGIASSPDSAHVTGAGQAVGTARYMSPEQVSGRNVTAASDLYSLGVVAYHCLAGRPPFLGNDPIAVARQHLEDEPPPLPADVPQPVRELVTRAMAKNPADRFPSAAALADAAAALAPGAKAGEPGAKTSLAGGPAGLAAGPAGLAAGPAGLAAGQAGLAAGQAQDAAPVPAPGQRRRRAVVWAAILAGLVVIGIVLLVADPIGLMPGPDRPPATPAPTSPGTGGGPGNGGSPGSDPTGTAPGAPGDTEGPGGGTTGGPGGGPGGGTTGGPGGGTTGGPGDPSGGTTGDPGGPSGGTTGGGTTGDEPSNGSQGDATDEPSP